jgi:cyclophilin family peptidyl-prolyl cis-trans isomerase
MLKAMRALAALLALLPALASPASPPRQAVLETTLGDIVIELDAARAPKSVEAFAAYAASGAYDGTLFHRVVRGFVVQGGEYVRGEGAQPPRHAAPPVPVPPFEPEVRNGLSNRRATVAMARDPAPGHGPAPQGFFINLDDNGFLDWRRFDAPTRVPTPRGPQLAPAGTETQGYAVFGRVVGGWDVVERISQVPVTAGMRPHDHLPSTPVFLKGVRLLPPP